MDRKALITTFTRCFRLIAKLSVTTDDKFFADLLNRESDKLLLCYINFLKYEGSVANSEGANHVAQCVAELIYKINGLVELFDIIGHFGLVKSPASLLLEKNLLCLELLILDFKKQPIQTGLSMKVSHQPLSKTVEKKSSQNLGKIHNEIAGFINSKEKVQNVEIFAKFASIARRTLKRKLSELIKTGAIKRVADGKKVFYVENIID